MYVPAANAVEDPELTLSMLRSAGAGHLVSVDSTGTLDSTLLPFLVDDDLGTVRAHMARANPHWRALDGATALMIVPISDAYVSPSWYETKGDDPRVVPTWNYELVHVHGTVHVRDDATFVESVVRSLTERHEAQRIEDFSELPDAAPPEWSVDDAPAGFIAKQLRAIVGIELAVVRVEAKRKLSQNRSDADRRGVIEGLSHSSRTASQAVADSMRTDLQR